MLNISKFGRTCACDVNSVIGNCHLELAYYIATLIILPSWVLHIYLFIQYLLFN